MDVWLACYSEDKLYEIEGDATKITELTVKERTFVTYFYQAKNIFYTMDKPQKVICKISQDKIDGICP